MKQLTRNWLQNLTIIAVFLGLLVLNEWSPMVDSVTAFVVVGGLFLASIVLVRKAWRSGDPDQRKRIMTDRLKGYHPKLRRWAFGEGDDFTGSSSVVGLVGYCVALILVLAYLSSLSSGGQ